MYIWEKADTLRYPNAVSGKLLIVIVNTGSKIPFYWSCTYLKTYLTSIESTSLKLSSGFLAT